MGSVQSPPSFRVKSVAIVGAGPSGLVTAAYLQAQAAFDRIVIFEQQLQVGGIWNYTRTPPAPVPAPQTDPLFPSHVPVRARARDPPVFPSPVYDTFHANTFKAIMSFAGRPFPRESGLFPSREDMQDYLVRYARDQDLLRLVRLGFQVKAISCQSDLGRDTWRVHARSTVDDMALDDVFDAVVVANGHYSTPFIPPIHGMAAFQEAYPSAISHSRQYRTADVFQDKKVIVVGNGASGTDIALQINRVSKGKTLLSVRTATPTERLAHTGCDETPEIEAFLVDSRGVRFKDGRVETDVDAVVFCTGYLFNFPFLPDLHPELVTTGRGVHGLYKHLFHICHPTLAFASLLIKSVPWPLAEAQAAVLAAVWSNNLELPPPREMQTWSRDLSDKNGEMLQHLQPGEDGRYINELHDWALTAEHLGKKPPQWHDGVFWQRTVMFEAKRRYEVDGCKAGTLEELGLQYDPRLEP